MAELKIVDDLGFGLNNPDPSYEKMRVDALNEATSNLWLCSKDTPQKNFWEIVKAWQRAKLLHDRAKKANWAPHIVNDPDIYEDMGADEVKSLNYEAMETELGL